MLGVSWAAGRQGKAPPRDEPREPVRRLASSDLIPAALASTTPAPAASTAPAPAASAAPAPEASTAPAPEAPAALAPAPSTRAPEARAPALSALVRDSEAGEPFGEETPLTQEQIGRLLAAAHHELYGVPPGPERLLIAWAHVAHEVSRGAGCIENNLGNMVVSLRWRGGFHLRKVADQTDRAQKRWVVQRVRYRSYATPYEGALDYWRFITGNFGSAFRFFDQGDALAAGRTLCERGYSTTSCEGYGQGIRGLYGELRATYALQLRAISRHREQPAMQAEDWGALDEQRGQITCSVRSEQGFP